MFRFLLTALLCGFAAQASLAEDAASSAESTSMFVDDTPGWLMRADLPVPNTDPDLDTSVDGQGVAYRLIDRRVNAATKTHYYRTVQTVVASHGLDTASRIEVDFDPSYQVLVWHAVEVHRGGEIQSRLDLDKIQLTRRYQDLESSIYDSSYTAFLLLDDLRVGDEVHKEYSIIGFNPVFGDRIAEWVYAGWSLPVERVVREYRMPPGRSLKMRMWNGVPEPEIETSDEGTVYRWVIDNAPAVEGENSVPSDWDSYPRLQVSEYDDWADVVRWALTLYPEVGIENELPESLQNLEGDVWQQANAILDFVQEDIRYLAITVGESTHRPSSPEETLPRRFGDCKAKAYLFCTLLRQIGIHAVPVLVNTAWECGIGEMLPMPGAFDHVIVRVSLPDGEFCWVDPTRTYQGGSLKSRRIGELGLGLPIAESADALEEIVESAAAAWRTEVEETFFLGRLDEPTRLELKTTYRGGSADRMRAQLGSSRRQELSEKFTSFYSGDYPEIRESKPYVVRDDRNVNEIVLEEFYELKNVWEPGDDEGAYAISFYPEAVRAWLERPKNPDRSAPFAVSHPRHIEQRTTVNLPEDWPEWDDDSEVDDPAFLVKVSARSRGNVFSYTASYETRSDRVQPEDMTAYARDVDQARRDLSYELTWVPDSGKDDDEVVEEAEEDSGDPSWLRIFLSPVLFLASIAAFFVAGAHMKKSPPALPGVEGPVGLGGWLVLVAIGAFLRCIMAIQGMIRGGVTYFDNAVWDGAVAAVARPWGVLLDWSFWAEYTLLHVSLALGIVFIIQFFRKHRSVPRLGITAFVINVILAVETVVALTLMASWVEPEEIVSASAELFFAVIAAAVWIAYFCVSKRVKNTFTR